MVTVARFWLPDSGYTKDADLEEASMAQADPKLHEHEWRASANWPPLTRMDIFGMAVAALGTAALVLIAAITADQDSGSYGAITIARILIATGALLINMAHIVGVLFFESVDYHGPFQRFFARLSLFGTVAAVIVSLAIGLL
jgi:hypothetical protein